VPVDAGLPRDVDGGPASDGGSDLREPLTFAPVSCGCSHGATPTWLIGVLGWAMARASRRSRRAPVRASSPTRPVVGVSSPAARPSPGSALNYDRHSSSSKESSCASPPPVLPASPSPRTKS
jgi:hypothetical protein